MRLLDKRTAQTQVAVQTKRQIDEGIALASKVDVLRGQKLTEEGNLRQFREEAIRATQAEIDALLKVKEELKGDIKILTDRKVEAQIPLDAAWHELRVELHKLSEEKESVAKRSFILKEEQEQLVRAEQELQSDKERVADLRMRAEEKLVEATTILKQAHEAAAEMRNKAQAALMEVELAKSDIAQEEVNLVLREERIEKEWIRIEQADSELLIREKQLADGRNTLERAMKRINK